MLVALNSSHVPFVRSGSALKPPCSVPVAERPVPTSRRPPERMSRVAVRSAIIVLHDAAAALRRSDLVRKTYLGEK